MALAAAEQTDSLYLDLQSEKDRALLPETEHFLSNNQNRFVITDEIHRVPSLFPVLRGLIDKGRRAGRKTSQFLILGSASIDLLKQFGESLAGRISLLRTWPTVRQRSLLSHPQIGLSWEGFVIDNVISVLADNCKAHFYRTSGGAEIDLVLHWTNGTTQAIEVKRSIKPAASRGFHEACEDTRASKRFIVYSGDDQFRLENGVNAMSTFKLLELLAS